MGHHNRQEKQVPPQTRQAESKDAKLREFETEAPIRIPGTEMVDETAYGKSVCGVRKRESWRELEESTVLRGRQTEEAQKEVSHNQTHRPISSSKYSSHQCRSVTVQALVITVNNQKAKTWKEKQGSSVLELGNKFQFKTNSSPLGMTSQKPVSIKILRSSLAPRGRLAKLL